MLICLSLWINFTAPQEFQHRVDLCLWNVEKCVNFLVRVEKLKLARTSIPAPIRRQNNDLVF